MAALEDPLLIVQGSVRLEDVGQREIRFPSGSAAWLALAFIPVALLSWMRARGYPKRSFRYIFDQHCLAYGMYLMWVRFFASGGARCLVVSNDHSVNNRVAVEAARDMGILTIYVQHASVTSAFPRLAVDFALLEGEDALRKYEAAGAAPARVYLVGMAKADRFEVHRSHRTPAVLGLCFNQYDSVADVEAACSALRTELPDVAISVRPHPRSSDRVLQGIREVAKASDCSLSDSRAEDIATFLSAVDVLVAGESSVHLEAVLCNVQPLYFTGNRPPRDVYGYLAHGLVGDHIGSLDELVGAVKEALVSTGSIRHRAKYYVDTVDTEYDGRSTEAVAEIVRQISATGTVLLNGWRRIDSEHFSEVWTAASDRLSEGEAIG